MEPEKSIRYLRHPPGWPDWWPGDPSDPCRVDWWQQLGPVADAVDSDPCRVDWCPPDDWPEELPEDVPYAHDYMTLEIVIDDGGTWDERWDAYIPDRGRWIQ